MDPITSQAEAANVTTEAPAATPAHEPQSTEALSPQALHEQLAASLNNPDWTPEAKAAPEKPAETVTEEAPAGDTPPETTEEAPAGTVDEPPAVAAETKTDDEHEEKPESKRYRFSDPADRQFATLRKEGVSPDEAARIAYGIGMTAETPTAEPEAPDELTTMTSELAEVDKQLDEAGANEGVFDASVSKLVKQRTDLAAKIATTAMRRELNADHAKRSQSEAAQALQSKQKAQADELVKQYPSLGTEGSPLQLEANRLFAHHQDIGSPLLREQDAPQQLAELAAHNVAKAQAKANGTHWTAEFAKLEAAKPAAKASAPVKEPTKPAAVPPKVSTASGAKATQTPDKPKSEEDELKAISAIRDPKEQQAAMNAYLYGKK